MGAKQNSFCHKEFHTNSIFALKNTQEIHFCIEKFILAQKIYKQKRFCAQKFTNKSLLLQEIHFDMKNHAIFYFRIKKNLKKHVCKENFILAIRNSPTNHFCAKEFTKKHFCLKSF